MTTCDRLTKRRIGSLRRSRRLALTVLSSGVILGIACLDPTRTRIFTVKIQPSRAVLIVGDTLRMRATAEDALGSPINVDQLEWMSSDSTVATVDSAGLVSTMAVGSAIIRVRSGTKEAAAALDVSHPVLVGAGDIAECSSDGAKRTATILDTVPGVVFTAGDNAYYNGSERAYRLCYAPFWGRHKARTRPAPGNHEYLTPNATGYFDYFGASAGARGEGYYSYNLGEWHIIVVNSSLPVAAGSVQEQWLRADLASHPRLCTLAYWHYPRFGSGYEGSYAIMQPMWDALYRAGVEVLISAHDHDYERFAPMDAMGRVDTSRGVTEFVVGTGGAALLSFRAPLTNSLVRNDSTWGVLKFTLRPDNYSWQFIPIAGKTFSDSGTRACH